MTKLRYWDYSRDSISKLHKNLTRHLATLGTNFIYLLWDFCLFKHIARRYGLSKLTAQYRFRIGKKVNGEDQKTDFLIKDSGFTMLY